MKTAKKLLSVLLCAITVFFTFAQGLSVSASDESLNEFVFESRNEEELIVSYAGNKDTFTEEIVFPSEFEGKPVTAIDKINYDACEHLTSVVVPDSITSIGYDTFSCCKMLKKITIDENNTVYSSDENGVLFSKDKSELIKYPRGNERTEYTVPDGVKVIGKDAFNGCDNLKTVTLPTGIKSIGEGAFENCSVLSGIAICSGTETIGSSAFAYCDNLTSVSLPESITHIGMYAFSESPVLDVYYSGGIAEKSKIEFDDLSLDIQLAVWHYHTDGSDKIGKGNPSTALIKIKDKMVTFTEKILYSLQSTALSVLLLPIVPVIALFISTVSNFYLALFALIPIAMITDN